MPTYWIGFLSNGQDLWHVVKCQPGSGTRSDEDVAAQTLAKEAKTWPLDRLKLFVEVPVQATIRLVNPADPPFPVDHYVSPANSPAEPNHATNTHRR